MSGELIDGDAGPDVGAVGLAGLGAGEEGRQGAGVIAPSVAVGVRLLLRQSGQDAEVVLQAGERLKSFGQFVPGPFGRREPVGHMLAVRDVQKRHPHRLRGLLGGRP